MLLLYLEAVDEGYCVYSLVPLQVSPLDACQLYMSIECIDSIYMDHMRSYSLNNAESDHATSVPGGSVGGILRV